MSLVFSDPTNRKGICELIDKRIGTDLISYPLLDKTIDINNALDDFTAIAIKASGKWQFDDSNQTDAPVIFIDLVAGQRSYAFTTDGTGNIILDIYKVMILPPAGIPYIEIDPVDEQSNTPVSMIDGRDIQGIPNCYDKTGNNIKLDLIPSYNMTRGLKVFINRESNYFASTDTTKKPGIVGLFHQYLVLKAAYVKAASLGLPQAGGRLRNGAFTGLLYEVTQMEENIKAYYGMRARDEAPVLKGEQKFFM